MKILRKNEYDLLMDPLGWAWSSGLGGPGLRVWVGPAFGFNWAAARLTYSSLSTVNAHANLSSNANFILSKLQMNM